MLALALAAVQAALLLAIASGAVVLGLSWDRVLHVTALAWLAAPLGGLVLGGAVHARRASVRSSTSASAARRTTTRASAAERVRRGGASQLLPDSYGRVEH